MLDETRRNALVPVVLRLALAAIFIYHGVDKIATKGNDWGSYWAVNMFERQWQPPEGGEDKGDEMKGESDSRKDLIKQKLRAVYQTEKRDLPGGLEFVGTQMAVAWGELVCGVAMLIGLFTRLSAVLMLVIQVGAIFTVTWAYGFTRPAGGGYEYNLVIIAGCVALLLAGPGLYSVDQYIKERKRTSTHTTTPTPAAV